MQQADCRKVAVQLEEFRPHRTVRKSGAVNLKCSKHDRFEERGYKPLGIVPQRRQSGVGYPAGTLLWVPVSS